MMRRVGIAALWLVVCGSRLAGGQACTLSISTLNFGTYNSVVLSGTTSGQVTCNGGWTIRFDAGVGAGGTINTRRLTGPGGAELKYRLYLDAARTTNWGNTDNTDLAGNGNTNITVYGQILAGQYVPQGSYVDTISTETTSFVVTAVVQPTCTLSANSLSFGTYAGTLKASTAIITVTCTKTANFDVGLDAGLTVGATVTSRSMRGPGASVLNYKLFSDSAYAKNWGNTVGTDTVPGTGDGAAQSLTVYGQIPAGQFVRPGSYADTIIATLTY